MRLRRIEIRDFRKLSHLLVEDLADGLNVLVGDNEAGKSTLLGALRTVLFERHRVGGSVLKAMLPHGQDVRPEITVDFALDDGLWRLRKAFNQRPEAELAGPGGLRITGDAVEEKMADLLGFQAPGNRGSKPDEHQGVYGLLWVDQGLAHNRLNAGAGQGTLASALESEVGLVLGGERGRHLLTLAEERRDTFWDRREQPKPRGDFRKLQDEVTALDLARSDLETRLRRHDDQIAMLAARTETLARHARDKRLEAAARGVETAQAAADRTTRIRATLDEVARARTRADEDRQRAVERLRTRGMLVDKSEADGANATRAAAQALEGRTLLEQAETRAKDVAERLRAARGRREAIDGRLHALDRALAVQTARQDHARASALLADLDAVARRQGEALALAGSIGVTKADLAALDKLCAERDQARLRLEAASVRITFTPSAAQAVDVDGVPHALPLPLLLSRDAHLDLAGFGRISVQPGGGVGDLARALEAAERRVADRLRTLGLAARNDVANALDRRTAAEADADIQKRHLAALAPKGLDVLRQQLRVLEIAADLDGEATSPPLATPDDRIDLRLAHDAALADETALETERSQADGERETAARQVAVLAERVATALRDRDASENALREARTAMSDADLARANEGAERAAALAAEAESSARAALDALDPEITALALRRALAADQAIRADIETLQREKRDLEIELRTLGKDGLGEQLDETEGRLVLKRRQLAALELDAKASLLLHRTLAIAQSETKDRWLGPVRERVRPYLKLIQPDSEIVLNEKTFSIEHLVRGGVNEPFETLSIGAREQVAVITRLALADILRISGHPSAVILDDALVNTDETRLDRMHMILQKASEMLQVIILTCRERDFLTLGAPIRRL